MKMRKLIIVLVGLGLSQFLSAFNPDSLQISNLYKAAVEADDAEQYDLALSKAMDALAIYALDTTQVDSLLGDITDFVGRIHLYQGDFDQAEEFFRRGLEVRKAVFGEWSVQVGKSYNNVGLVFNERNELDEAQAFLEKSITVYDRQLQRNDLLFSKPYSNLAIIFAKKGDFAKANFYFRNVVTIDEANLPQNSIELAMDYNNLATSFDLIKKHAKALHYFNKSLEIYNKYTDKYDSKKASILNNLASLYFRIEEFQEAIISNKLSIKHRIKVFGPEHDKLAYVYIGLSKCYSKLNDNAAAINSLNIAKSIRVKKFGREHDLVQTCNLLLGKEYLRIHKYDRALRFLNEGLSNYKSQSKFFNNENIVRLYETKADVNKALYDSTTKKQFLISAKKNIEKAVKFFELWRANLQDNESKSLINEIHLSIYEKAINLNFILHSITGAKDYQSKCVDLVNKSKTNLLREGLKHTKALKYSGIPDSLVILESKLRSKISEIEISMFSDSFSISQSKLDSTLFYEKSKYNNLLESLKSQYPRFYNLKLDNLPINPKDINSKLEDETLVEFYLGDSILFALLFQKDTTIIKRIVPNIDIKLNVKELRKTIDSVVDSPTETHLNDSLFLKTSRNLYDVLLKPFERVLTKKLIIVPDGILYLLPFEALVVEDPRSMWNYKSLSYLINQYTISYVYSAKMLNRSNKNHKNLNGKILAMAPSFSEEFKSKNYSHNTAFEDLLNNDEEIQIVMKMVNGVGLSGSKATKENFVNMSNAYNFIHLATHGISNDDNGNMSFLAFTNVDDSNENDILYANEIYNLKLDSELIVLSACETGIGELLKGEGVISLARAFFYAGAKSVLTTLWKISDNETLEIITLFYKNLKNGMTKDSALRNAKLEYISNNSNRIAHPFYWASFTPVGIMEEVELQSPPEYWKYFILVILGIMIVLGTFKLAKNNHLWMN